MSDLVKRVTVVIQEELYRQKIASSWGNAFEGLNPPVNWDAVSCAVISEVRISAAKDVLQVAENILRNGVLK
jgi:hypothetical protein